MQYYEKFKRESLGQEQNFWFSNWQYFTRYLLKMNSAGTLSASRINPHPQIKLSAVNKSNDTLTTGV